MTRPTPPSLAELARAVGRLTPDWTRPDRYYRARDEIADRSHELATESSTTKRIA